MSNKFKFEVSVCGKGCRFKVSRKLTKLANENDGIETWHNSEFSGYIVKRVTVYHYLRQIHVSLVKH